MFPASTPPPPPHTHTRGSRQRNSQHTSSSRDCPCRLRFENASFHLACSLLKCCRQIVLCKIHDLPYIPATSRTHGCGADRWGEDIILLSITHASALLFSLLCCFVLVFAWSTFLSCDTLFEIVENNWRNLPCSYSF